MKINRRDFIKKSASLSAFSFLGLGLTCGCKDTQTPTDKNTVDIDISVAQGEDYSANTMRAVENLGGMEVFVPKGSKIAILANPQRNNPGAFTKPDILRAAIQMCQQS
ncbi:MAG: hypothetical protein ACQERH_08920, partial [Acidobacteriota bacterium]